MYKQNKLCDKKIEADAPIVTEEMERVGVDVLLRSDFRYPVEFDNVFDIVREIFLAMSAVASQSQDKNQIATHGSTHESGKQRS